MEKRVQILNLLVEGASLRAISRLTGCSINTVTKLLVQVGKASSEHLHTNLTNLKCTRVECDEIWSFVYAKKKNVPEGMENVGEVWTWVAIDPESKLVVSFMVGDRSTETAIEFMKDVSSRLSKRVQLTTDGHKPYLEAVEEVFGSNIDYAQLVKIYGGSKEKKPNKRYSQALISEVKKRKVSGNPDEEKVSTNSVERQNLTMRMHMRRFTRLTNAFSKKMDNHIYAISLHFFYYNFIKIHKTLRVTPAMEAGITKKLWSLEDLLAIA